jgi:short-subunit dehydrogenase
MGGGDAEFAARYGPWALIAGASQGVGREFARRVAAKGVHCVLIARREGPLAELAGRIRNESGVECLTASVDLSAPDALDRVLSVVDGREIGLFVANAGADPDPSHFLDRKIETWIDLVNLNVLTTMRACHHFGGLMRERRRGGLLLVGSGACYGGTDSVAAYSGSKAFDLCFGESLWVELRSHGVDVLALVLGITDTPQLRRLLAERGQPVPRFVASPERVAEVGLARLPRGPTYSWMPFAGLHAGWRRLRVRASSAVSRRVMGEGG